MSYGSQILDFILASGATLQVSHEPRLVLAACKLGWAHKY